MISSNYSGNMLIATCLLPMLLSLSNLIYLNKLFSSFPTSWNDSFNYFGLVRKVFTRFQPLFLIIFYVCSSLYFY